MKKIILSLFTVLIMGLFFSTPVEASEAISVNPDTIYYITSPYCTTCQEAEAFFKDHPGFKESFHTLDVTVPGDKAMIDAVLEAANLDKLVTPLFIRGTEVLTGWNPVVTTSLAGWANFPLDDVEVPFENIDTDSFWGLVLITFILGNIDGVNPCSIWALMFLMTMMITRNYNKKQIFIIGGVYILTIAAFYALYIVGVSFFTGNILENFYLRFAIFITAGIIGLSNIFVAFNIKIPFKFSIQDEHKKDFLKFAGRRLKERKEKNSLVQLSITAVSLGVFASLIELPCTAGFPIIWNGYMKDAGVDGMSYLLFLSGYMFLYVLIECVILFGITLSMKKVQINNRAGMSLKVGSGVLMLWLGFSLLLGDVLVRNTNLLLIVTGISTVAGLLYYWKYKD